MAGVSEWSATADENTTVDGINIAEHCPAKNMNDALRAVMAALKAKCDALDSTDNTLRRGAVIGEIRWFAMSTPPEGWLVCNGAAVSTSDYAALFAAIGNIFLPEGVSASPITFNLPNLMGKVPWGATSVGTVIDVGLPDIQGLCVLHGSEQANIINAASGAITLEYKHNSYRTPAQLTESPGAISGGGFTFRASSYNSIYGNSDTVQPPALCLRPCIRYE